MQLDEKEHKNDHFADDAIVYLKNKHLKKKQKKQASIKLPGYKIINQNQELSN